MIALSLAIVVGIASVFFIDRNPKALTFVVGAGWVGLLAGFSAIYFAESVDVATLIGVATFGAFAGLPLHLDGTARRVSVTFASVFAMSAAIVAWFVFQSPRVGQFAVGHVMVCAVWTALFATGANLCAATALRNRDTETPMFVLVSAAAAFAAIAAGVGRSSLRDVGYALTIRSDDAPLVFSIEPMRGLEEGAVLAVASPSSTLFAMWVAFALLGLGGAIFVAVREMPFSKYVVGGLAALGAVTGITLYSTIKSISLPGDEPYRDAIKQALLTNKIPGEIVEQASFSGLDNLNVSFADLVPELFAIVFAILCAAAFFLTRSSTEREQEPKYRRDLFARGIVWMWLAWCMASVFHGTELGTPGIMSPSEWIFTGVTIFSTGVLIATWSPKNRVVEVGQTLAPAVVLGALIIAAAVAYRFGAPLGLSLTVLR